MVKFGQLWALFPEDTHVKFMALVGSYVSIYTTALSLRPSIQAKIWTERNQLGDDVKNLKNQIDSSNISTLIRLSLS
jgi:hypothetical protein